MFETKYTLGDKVKCILHCIGALQFTFKKHAILVLNRVKFCEKKNYTLSSNQCGEIISLLDPMTHCSQKCTGSKIQDEIHGVQERS